MPTVDHEAAVRQAATKLSKTIADANDAGLHVAWPRNVEGLDEIAISETGKSPGGVLGTVVINADDLTDTADSKTTKKKG